VLPENSHRAGTVPIIFEDGSRTKIRVFGYLPYKPAPGFCQEFEQCIRRLCEDEEIYTQLFGPHVAVTQARRFNPALAQRHRGW